MFLYEFFLSGFKVKLNALNFLILFIKFLLVDLQVWFYLSQLQVLLRKLVFMATHTFLKILQFTFILEPGLVQSVIVFILQKKNSFWMIFPNLVNQRGMVASQIWNLQSVFISDPCNL
jgi:hypothetical protein